MIGGVGGLFVPSDIPVHKLIFMHCSYISGIRKLFRP